MIKQCYHGYLARKCFGQNFLKDQKVIDDIVTNINPKKDQIMIEIGPGLAALTEPIVKQTDHLIVIELDRNLVTRLQTNRLLKSKLTIYQQDAVTVNFGKLSEQLGKPLRIFGNLPYNIATSLILHLFKYIDVITDMYFMVQKEVANRLVARPNSKAYGRLSVIAQYYCQVIAILEVLPNSFVPSPKVNSTVVRLIPYTIMPHPSTNINILSYVTRLAFSQRRKIVRNSLNDLLTDDILTLLNIDPNMRAENISVLKYCQISNFIERTTLQK